LFRSVCALLSAVAATVATNPASAEPRRVACVGDSITYGSGLADRRASSYPARLGRLLGEDFMVRNFGRSGSSVLAATKTSGGRFLGSKEHAASLAFRPQIVFINLGINDINFFRGRESAFESEYGELIRTYSSLAEKPKVFVWSPLAPLMPGHRFHPLDVEIGAVMAERIRSAAVAEGAQTIDMRTPLSARAALFPDRIHPDASGAAIIALETARALGRVSTGLVSLDSFETLPAGEFRELESAIGSWSAAKGHAEIDPHHRFDGLQCLHLFGGKDRSVELEIAGERAGPVSLTFQAERWTSRSPFEFAVEARRDGKWAEVYRGDRTIRVGGFLTRVAIDRIEPDVDRIRFRSTSPASSGVLIDNVRISRPTKMRVLRTEAAQLVTPVLVGLEAGPVLRLRIDVEGRLEPLSLKSLDLSTIGTADLGDVESVSVYSTGVRSRLSARQTTSPNLFDGAARFGEVHPAVKSLTIRGTQTLEEGANYFWIAMRLSASANVDHRVDASCESIELSSGLRLSPENASPAGSKRLGVALRKARDDGVTSYRIPGLATSNSGTLIAVYDCRNRSGSDLPGDIDVGMSRSTDGGRTWEPMQRIIDYPAAKDRRYGNGVGDPAVLVDRRRGTIWVGALWSHGNRGWHGSRPGMLPKETGQFVLTKSDDDGKTWSPAINITEQIKNPSWRLLLQGPGAGITMRDGTLVFAAQFRDGDGIPHSTIISSRDGGETWKIGTGAKPKTTEAQVVERRDGSLMLNMRDDRGGSRSVYVTYDLGRSWIEHPTSRRALPEPVCMASLIRFSPPGDQDLRGPLLFSNPNVSRAPRRRITIQASTDDGAIWTESSRVLLDEGIGAGYSCMTRIDADTIGILYEGSSSHLVFQRVRLDEVLQP